MNRPNIHAPKAVAARRLQLQLRSFVIRQGHPWHQSSPSHPPQPSANVLVATGMQLWQKTPHTLLAFSTGHPSVRTAPTGRSPNPGLQSLDRCCGHVCNTQSYTSELLQPAQTLQGAPVGAANTQLLRRCAQWVASQIKCSALWACCDLGLGFTGVLWCARLTQRAQFVGGSLVCCAVHCAWSSACAQ